MKLLYELSEAYAYEVDTNRLPLLLRHIGLGGEDPRYIRAYVSLARKQHRRVPEIYRKHRAKSRRSRVSKQTPLHTLISRLSALMGRIHKAVPVS